MTKKTPAANKNTVQPSFSKRFNEALIATRLMDAMVKADGWTLAQLVESPPWLRELYHRHANAARRAIQELEAGENNFKPSEHN